MLSASSSWPLSRDTAQAICCGADLSEALWEHRGSGTMLGTGTLGATVAGWGMLRRASELELPFT